VRQPAVETVLQVYLLKEGLDHGEEEGCEEGCEEGDKEGRQEEVSESGCRQEVCIVATVAVN
jgi:flagellar biosynthesis/type III secretory pathway protein FliH